MIVTYFLPLFMSFPSLFKTELHSKHFFRSNEWKSKKSLAGGKNKQKQNMTKRNITKYGQLTKDY